MEGFTCGSIYFPKWAKPEDAGPPVPQWAQGQSPGRGSGGQSPQKLKHNCTIVNVFLEKM